VEFRDDGAADPYLIEVNGRFWGSTQLAMELGLDVPRAWVELLGGKRVEPALDYPAGVTLRWLWGDVKRCLTILKGRPEGFPGAYPTRLQGMAELVQRQPAGTRLETWKPEDPWPAVGEWTQGICDLLEVGRSRGRALYRSLRPVPSLELGIDRQ
jgi:hypothetical protein